MSIFKKIETYIASLLLGAIAHWLSAHPGVVDPFVSGTLAGAITAAFGAHLNGNDPGDH